jgi:hypothetical protein
MKLAISLSKRIWRTGDSPPTITIFWIVDIVYIDAMRAAMEKRQGDMGIKRVRPICDRLYTVTGNPTEGQGNRVGQTEQNCLLISIPRS